MHGGAEKLLSLMSCEVECCRTMPAGEDVVRIMRSFVGSDALMTRVG